MPPSPKNLGKYALERELGRGGMGVVIEALDTELNRKVALKLLLGNSLSDDATRTVEEERFVREAQLSAKLKHPNIVSVYEAGTLEGKRYLAMQLIEGVSLAAWLRKEPQAGLRQKVALLRDVALAVAHAHDQGILHRDLKPQNVLLDAEGRPYVTDFGLAKRAGHDATASLTVSGSVVGTPSYMSPEQARGLKTVDARSDVYSLGIMLYEMLAGRTPFQGDTPIDILMKVVNHPAPPPSQTAKKWEESAAADAIENICMKAIAKDPRQRFPTAQAFADDLGRWLKGQQVKAAPPTPRGSLSWLWISIGLAAAAALAVVFLMPSDPPPTEPPRKVSRSPQAKTEADPEKERLERDRKTAAEEADRLKREATKEREEALLRDADRIKRSEAEKRASNAEKEALTAKLREMEERARAAEEEARKAKLTPTVKPAEPPPVKPPSEPVRAPDRPAIAAEPPKVPPPAMAPRKLQEPASAEFKAAEKSIQTQFKADYAKKLPADRRALAARLLELGRKEDAEPAVRFAYLQEARELSSLNGDADGSVAAVDALVRSFQVDAKSLRSQTLQALAKSAVAPTGMKEAGVAGLQLAAGAVAEDDYDAALQLLAQVDLLSKRAKDPPLVAAVQDRLRDTTEMRKEWGHVRASFKTLQEKPDDPASNTLAGRFLCFVKQDWERGLPHLSRSEVEPLRAAAQREIAAATPALLLEAGEAWSALPEKQAAAKARIADHGVALYRKAWPDAREAVRESLRAKFKAISFRPGRVTPGLPAQWATWLDASREPFAVDEGVAHSGRASLRITAFPKTGNIMFPVKKIPAGRTVTLTAWLLTDRSEALEACVYVGTSDGVNPNSARNFTTPAPADRPWWTLVQTTFIVSPDTQSMSVYVQNGCRTGAMWVDDVSLRLDDGTEILEAGTFEK